MKKRIISILLAFNILFSIAGVSLAVENRASHYLDDYYVSLTAIGNGVMTVSVVVNGVSKQDKIGVQEIVIQQKIDGVWEYYDTLDGSEFPEFYEYNSYEYVNEIDFKGTPGVVYRVTITAFAQKNGGWDTGYVTSYGETCK